MRSVAGLGWSAALAGLVASWLRARLARTCVASSNQVPLRA
tara:strand:- start:10701 stop:10823 length:123 start_codon:yes stop_codon:yes gene_type:complete